MSNQSGPKLSSWAYMAAFAGDTVLLGIVAVICLRHGPIGGWVAAMMVFAGAAGAALAVLPFILEYRVAVRMVETGAMMSAVEQIQNLEEVANHIGTATGQWQGVHEHATRTMNAAKDITERISKEASAFAEFIKKANESEKATLRLEVEKLRRAEADWLQIVVRLLDHTYALHQAAVRSGQQSLIEQLTNFQTACREVARRVGLVPFTATANGAFDPKNHQLADPNVKPATDAKIHDTLATGYTFQGRLVRPALVSLREPAPSVLDEPQPLTEVDAEIAPSPAKSDEAVEVEEEQTLL